MDLQNGQSNCIFVVQFGGESSESIVKRREVYEADTKGSRRIAEEFYTYIVSWRKGIIFNGQFTPEFDIMGLVTLNKCYAYYGEDNYAKWNVKEGGTRMMIRE